MFKFLIFLALLACSSFLITDAFSVDVELLKESDRILDTMGWLDLDTDPFQEQIQIIINPATSKHRISVMILSTDNEDIRFPNELESKTIDPQVISIIFTNRFNCAQVPAFPERDACIIVAVEKKGLGDELADLQVEIIKGVSKAEQEKK